MTDFTESNFFEYKGDKGVAISRSVPHWWRGRRYSKLAPTYSLLHLWRGGYIGENEYTSIYNRDVLGQLNKEEVRKELREGAVLLCWERSGFCHRHLAVEWLNS